MCIYICIYIYVYIYIFVLSCIPLVGFQRRTKTVNINRQTPAVCTNLMQSDLDIKHKIEI